MFTVPFVRSLIVLMICFPFVWDWWAIRAGHSDLTITNTFRTWAQSEPLLPFLLGGLAFHLVWFTLSEGAAPPPPPPAVP